VPFGDVLLARLPFPDGEGFKTRPILVLTETDDHDMLVVPITSHPVRGDFDIPLRDWGEAGLRLPSTARISKVGTIARATAIRNLGQLTSRDRADVEATVRRFFAAIQDSLEGRG
jgi:mRNA-degrading endonuclease toxin of MazEF toxin-antitoxin module